MDLNFLFLKKAIFFGQKRRKAPPTK
jgi:hypothetical protein